VIVGCLFTVRCFIKRVYSDQIDQELSQQDSISDEHGKTSFCLKVSNITLYKEIHDCE